MTGEKPLHSKEKDEEPRIQVGVSGGGYKELTIARWLALSRRLAARGVTTELTLRISPAKKTRKGDVQ